MRGQRENFRKAVQSFEIKKRKIDIYGNYEANGVEKNQRKFEIFSTLISKKSKMTGIPSLSRKLMNSSNWSGCEANASKSYNKIVSGGLPSLGNKK